MKMPNVRKLFIPDPGYMIGDFDLAQADAQVVAWEANDEILKEIFRTKADLHTINAEMLGCPRSVAKAACHAMNYGTGVNTLATLLGKTRHEADTLRHKWFDLHPAIKEWHRKTEMDLQTKRCIQNAFGYRRYYFGRIDGLLPEALAWIPQSTVGLIINKVLIKLQPHREWIHPLMQVHDSIVVQFPSHRAREALLTVKAAFEVEVPYQDPLIIPAGAAVSLQSWGDVSKVDWPE